jgi:hypothetical protein
MKHAVTPFNSPEAVRNVEPASISSSNTSQGNPKLSAVNETLSSAQTETSSSWGDWFMGILHSVLGWLCCCCEKEAEKADKKEDEAGKPLPLVFEDPALNEFYHLVMDDKADLSHFSPKIDGKFKQLSKPLQEQIIRLDAVLTQAVDAKVAKEWPSLSLDISDLTVGTDETMEFRLVLKWMLYKEEWTTFYRTYLKEGSLPISNAELNKHYKELSLDGRETINQIAKRLRLCFPALIRLFVNAERNRSHNTLFENFFKFLVGEEDYDASALAHNQYQKYEYEELFECCTPYEQRLLIGGNLVSSIVWIKKGSPEDLSS